MKKLLFLHDSLEMGGAEKLRLTLLKNIDRSRYQIKICCISHKGMVGEEIEKLGFTIDELKLNSRPRCPLTTLRIIKYMRLYRPDILHTSLFNANFHGRIAGFLCRIPCIIAEVHGQYYEFINFRFLPFLFAEQLLYKVTDNIICCSESSKQDIINKRKLSPKKIKAISNCIDPVLYTIREDRNKIRIKLGIKDEFVLITVASFWKMKGHIYLLRALFELRQAGYIFKWICAGDGPLRSTILKMCVKLKLTDNVVFLGKVDNVADYLNASDLFVLPSLSEALSIALIEAMHIGLPCIATDVGSNRELIENNINGIIVEPQNIEALKGTILFCFNNRGLIKQFGHNNTEKVKKKYLFSSKYIQEFYKIWGNGSAKIDEFTNKKI